MLFESRWFHRIAQGTCVPRHMILAHCLAFSVHNVASNPMELILELFSNYWKYRLLCHWIWTWEYTGLKNLVENLPLHRPRLNQLRVINGDTETCWHNLVPGLNIIHNSSPWSLLLLGIRKFILGPRLKKKCICISYFSQILSHL